MQFFLFCRLHGEPPFVASTEEDLQDLIKKADLNFCMQHWDDVTSNGIHFLIVSLMKCHYYYCFHCYFYQIFMKDFSTVTSCYTRYIQYIYV